MINTVLQRDTGATASVVRDWGRSFFRQLCSQLRHHDQLGLRGASDSGGRWHIAGTRSEPVWCFLSHHPTFTPSQRGWTTQPSVLVVFYATANGVFTKADLTVFCPYWLAFSANDDRLTRQGGSRRIGARTRVVCDIAASDHARSQFYFR